MSHPKWHVAHSNLASVLFCVCGSDEPRCAAVALPCFLRSKASQEARWRPPIVNTPSVFHSRPSTSSSRNRPCYGGWLVRGTTSRLAWFSGSAHGPRATPTKARVFFPELQVLLANRGPAGNCTNGG